VWLFSMDVMFLAVLGLASPVSLAHTSALRSVLSIFVNSIAAVPVLRAAPFVIGLGTAIKLLV
jgi:hypothetical protein